MEQPTFTYMGKGQTVWTEKQLDAMGKGALRQRALDIRDLVGDSMPLPPMPRSEGLPRWIMGVQAAMMDSHYQGYQGYDARPQRGPVSEAGSVRSSTAWGRQQLESMGKSALQQRAMNLRDAASPFMDLPPMPRHVDLLPGWIMGVQAALDEENPSSFEPPPRMNTSGYDFQSQGEAPPRAQPSGYDFQPQGSHARHMDEVSNAGTYVSQAGSTLWTEKQLESMSKGGLKQRALDLRDRCGPDCPPMPRHPDLLPRWILSMQAAMNSNEWRSDAGSQMRLPSQSFPPSYPDKRDVVNDDYEEKSIAAQFRDRNMSSRIF